MMAFATSFPIPIRPLIRLQGFWRIMQHANFIRQSNIFGFPGSPGYRLCLNRCSEKRDPAARGFTACDKNDRYRRSTGPGVHQKLQNNLLCPQANGGKMRLSHKLLTLCAAFAVASCASMHPQPPEVQLPPERISLKGFSLVPLNEHGWLIGMRNPRLLSLGKLGKYPEENIEPIAKPFVIPECLYREYGFSSS